MYKSDRNIAYATTVSFGDLCKISAWSDHCSSCESKTYVQRNWIVSSYTFGVTIPRAPCWYMPHIVVVGHTFRELTHLSLDKTAAILQTTFSNAFLWMKPLHKPILSQFTDAYMRP